jgi:hypothetical protein
VIVVCFVVMWSFIVALCYLVSANVLLPGDPKDLYILVT